MIREIPVDTSRLNVISTGHVTPVNPWVPDPANPGRNMPGPEQARDEITGLLLWNVDVLVKEEGVRPEVVGVQVGAPVQPVLEEFKPVNFVGLVCTVSVDRNAARPQVRQYWTASSISDGKFHAKPAPTPYGGDNKDSKAS